MAKKKAADEAQAELDREPSRRQPEPEPQAEAKKPAGKSIGAWRKEALRYLGKGAEDSDVTAHVNELAKEGGYAYSTTDEETAGWRPRVQAELDGATKPRETTTRAPRHTPPPATRAPRRTASPASAEPTLTDLLAVMEVVGTDLGARLTRWKQAEPLKAWQGIAEAVQRLVDAVGGFPQLFRCLEAIDKLSTFAAAKKRR